MARSKKAKARKAGRNTYIGAKQNHLSMQQEARNTEGRNLWRLDVQFRHQTVQFVRAGSLEPTPDKDSTAITQEAPGIQEIIAMEPIPGSEMRCESRSDADPFSEAEMDRPVLPSLPSPTHSSVPEDSSEDEIVFHGRRNKTEPMSYLRTHNLPVVNNDQEGRTDGEFPEDSTNHDMLPGVTAERSGSNSVTKDLPNYVAINVAEDSSTETSDEDEILADYIANMDDDYEYRDIRSSANEDSIEDDSHTTRAAAVDIDDLTCDSEAVDTDFDLCETSSKLEPENCANHIFHDTAGSKLGGPFASATAFADALELDPYYGFDIMDFNRPSLRKKKKGKCINLGLLDTELETELLNAWNNDRLRKKIRKQEREELRSQGLLGRSKNDPDLKTKYEDGMGIEDLKSEIRLFLLSPKNSLSLPPMSKHRRILVHDVANALRLSSQSRGKGSSRFPILSKTSRTPKYTHRTISQIDRIFLKDRFSSRAMKAWDKTSGRSANANRGHGNVSYMDGDIVGASAPEIGAENKGRAMLERMGWSTGTALGATHNKGILLPVSHVVKNSKAGLG